MFYVYTLTDPRDGAVFYVGKGKGARLEAHEREAASGKPGEKCDRIRDIWASGVRVAKKIVERFREERAALDAERRLIAALGLSTLTNIAPGGGRGRHKRRARWTPKMIRKVAPSLRGALLRAAAGNGRLYMGDMEITEHVVDLIQTLRREAGDDMLREHAGVSFGQTEQVQAGVC